MQTLIRRLILLLTMLPGPVLAIGMGAIQIQSSLHEPLRAQIPLLNITREEINEITVALASDEVSQRFGRQPSTELPRLQFDPELSPNGKAFIKVRTQEPIRKPILSFLVEVKWDGGRQFREYTIDLHPGVRAAQLVRAQSNPELATSQNAITDFDEAMMSEEAIEPYAVGDEVTYSAGDVEDMRRYIQELEHTLSEQQMMIFNQRQQITRFKQLVGAADELTNVDKSDALVVVKAGENQINYGLIIGVLALGWLWLRLRRARTYKTETNTHAVVYLDQKPVIQKTKHKIVEDDVSQDIIEDALREADIYISYNHHDKAEALLRDELLHNPERTDCMLKLLEVHLSTNNKEAFDETTEQLHAALGDEHSELWDAAVEMGRRISPENPLFRDVDAA